MAPAVTAPIDHSHSEVPATMNSSSALRQLSATVSSVTNRNCWCTVSRKWLMLSRA